MKKLVNIHAAKTHLSQLVERAEAGEETVIARSGKPVARLVPLLERFNLEARARRPLGQLAHLGPVAENYDDPLPAAILREFAGQ